LLEALVSDNSKSKKRSWTAKLILCALLAFFLFELQYVGRIILFDFVNPSSSPYIRTEQERLLEEGKHPVLYQWVDYDQISPYLIRAVVAAEDADFMHHNGLRWDAIKTAAERNLLSDKRAPGGSTLTQQTVKNLFLSHDRSYFRKAQEIILTPIVEAIWDKKRILEIYLNIAEFGNGIFGAQAASRYYFNKNAANLSRAEAIRLASILINPKKYQFVKSAPLINRRVNRISHDLNLVQIPQR
jgi:monofunctional biosynthetic peptidoglycan transglycosylase